MSASVDCPHGSCRHMTRTGLTATLAICLASCGSPLFAANDDGAHDLGVDYAFLTLMTLSPDFAAANYTIDNGTGGDVSVSIGRFPYHVDLLKQDEQRWQLEIALAYQTTREQLDVESTTDHIDAEWDTYGIGLGLLYERELSDSLLFTPSLRAGVARLSNDASYQGAFIQGFASQFDGITFNWQTQATLMSLGLGLRYHWTLLDRSSRVNANLYHTRVKSFDEGNPALAFSEGANMLALNMDIVEPTESSLLGERLDLVWLFGINQFLGDNRNTLGYTRSYQAGAGIEFPLGTLDDQRYFVRLGGQWLWADNMSGWLLTLAINSETSGKH